jgi:Prophage CP4-57 regulatory protein (AlpA)
MNFLLRADLQKRDHRWSNKHLLHLEKRGKFPRRCYLSDRTPAWTEAEIEAFEAARVAERDGRPCDEAA